MITQFALKFENLKQLRFRFAGNSVFKDNNMVLLFWEKLNNIVKKNQSIVELELVPSFFLDINRLTQFIKQSKLIINKIDIDIDFSNFFVVTQKLTQDITYTRVSKFQFWLHLL